MLEITSDHSYGSVTQVEQDGEDQKLLGLEIRSEKARDSERGSHRVRIASRPCLIPFDLASWAVIKPLAGRQTLRRKRKQREERTKKRKEKNE